MKLRNDSTLSTLTEEQQAQLYDWLQTLGYTETLKRVAAPPPVGFGLNTHRATLHGFFRRYSQTVRTEDVATARETRFNSEDSSVLAADAEQSFVHAAHQLATGPMNSDDFSNVARWLDSRKDETLKRFYAGLAEQNAAVAQKKVALAEKRLQLDTEKFRFNAARQALVHFAEITEVARKPDSDNEDKIRAVADLLFKQAPEPPNWKTTPDSPNSTPLWQSDQIKSEI